MIVLNPKPYHIDTNHLQKGSNRKMSNAAVLIHVLRTMEHGTSRKDTGDCREVPLGGSLRKLGKTSNSSKHALLERPGFS